MNKQQPSNDLPTLIRLRRLISVAGASALSVAVLVLVIDLPRWLLISLGLSLLLWFDVFVRLTKRIADRRAADHHHARDR
jgi:hypothetical protein